MTEENNVLEDKKLLSQKQYLRLLPQLRDCIKREQQIFDQIKRVGRHAGYAEHEVLCDLRKFV